MTSSVLGASLAIMGDDVFPFPEASLEDSSIKKQFEMVMSLNLFVSELHEDLFALIPLSQVSVEEDLA